MTSTQSSDHALRTMDEEGNFRIIVASTRETANGILEAQSPDEASRGMLADVVTASVMLRLTMSPDYRLQTILQDPQAGRIVGDSHPDGTTRGLVQRYGETPFATGGSTQLSVHRNIFGGETHEGIVQTSEQQTLSDAVTGYLHRSEQIKSVVGIGHTFDGDELSFAGGYLVQLVTEDEELDQADLALLTARLENLPDVPGLFEECDGETEKVAEALYGPLEFKSLETNEFQSGCVCSPQRVLQALGTLSDDDRRELAESDEPLEVDCDYCETTHEIAPEDLGD